MIAGPVYMVALLLATAAVAKLAAPRPTRAALYAMALPSATAMVVVLAVAELAVAAALVVFGGRAPAALLAAIYLGFAVFVGVGVRTGKLSSCGCFGDASVAPGPLHVGYNIVATTVALLAVIWPVPAADVLLDDQPWAGIPFLGVVALGTVLSWAVLSVLPPALHPPRRAAAFALADAEPAGVRS